MANRKKVLVFTKSHQHFAYLKRSYDYLHDRVEFVHCYDEHGLRGGVHADAFMWHSQWPDHAGLMLDIMMSRKVLEIEDPESIL